MVNLEDFKIFQDNVSTLKDTSEDKRGSKQANYMTLSSINAVNFDKVKSQYSSQHLLTQLPQSNDALFCDNNNTLYFVEFKNGFLDKKEQYSLQRKIYDSILIFTDITSTCLDELRKNMEYILVYNSSANEGNRDAVLKKKSDNVQNSPSFDQFAKTLSQFSKKEYICFGLDYFEKYCFKKVHTYNELEFQNFLQVLNVL